MTARRYRGCRDRQPFVHPVVVTAVQEDCDSGTLGGHVGLSYRWAAKAVHLHGV
jgi:hypothetical protein